MSLRTAKNIFLHFLLLLITAIVSAHLVWKYTPVKKDVKRKIIKTLRPYLGKQLTIEHFNVGFGTVSFDSTIITDSRGKFGVRFKSVELRFSAGKLVRSRFDPKRAIQSITVREPEIDLFERDKGDSTSNAVQAARKILQSIARLQNLPGIDRVKISGGKIFWHKKDGERSAILQQMDGFVRQEQTQSIVAELQGHLFGAPESHISIKSRMDLPRRTWKTVLDLRDCDLPENYAFLGNADYILRRANLRGQIIIENKDFIADSTRFSGTVLMKNFTGLIFNQGAVADSIHLRFKRQSLIIDPFRGEVETGRVTFYGSVDNLLRPEVHFVLDFADYPVKHLRQSHSVFEYADKGNARGHLEFDGPPGNITIRGEAVAPYLLYAVVPFTHVQTRFTYHQRLLNFSYLRADFMKFRSQGTGEVNFNTDSLAFRIHSDLAIAPGTFRIFDQLSASKLNIYTKFEGDYIQKLFDGSSRYVFQRQDSVLFRGSGPLHLDDQLLTFALRSQGIPDTAIVRGRVAQIFSDPTFRILDIKNLPIKRFSRNPIVRGLAKKFRTNLYFAGPYNSLNGKAKMISRKTRNTDFTVLGNIRELFEEGQNFSGRFIGHTRPKEFTGTYQIAYQDSGINVRLTSPGVFAGNLFMAYQPSGPFSGKLTVERFPITDYLSPDGHFGYGILQGFLSGGVTFAGTVASPEVRFHLAAEQFIINKVGYYSTRMNGLLRGQKLVFHNFAVDWNGSPIFNADYSWDMAADTMALAIRGDNIESNFLAETIFRDPNLIRGAFSYRIFAHGPFEHPSVYGTVQIENGVLQEYPFDSISLSFEDSLRTGGKFYDLTQHILKIQNFNYQNRAEYNVDARGLLGLGPEAPIDLDVNVQGNILAELPKIEPYFRNPRSEGTLTVHVSGTRNNPAFAEAHLQIFDGSLEFESVIPPLKNLKADIELKKNSDFVHIRNISGTIEDRWGKIYNVPNVPSLADSLRPWRFGAYGLNFGVLVLETDERGLPLSIPGLMEPKDIGYFTATGLKPGEKFYLAGPVDVPHARGGVILQNARVTFPFIGMDDESSDSSAVVNFLMNTVWDVMTKVKSGTRYFVDIPAYVGKVYMDLNIDDVSKGLHFTGKLKDESFRTDGSVVSTRGRVEYLDVNFRVEKFEADFSPLDIFPEVSGRAFTTVRDSSGNFPRDVYLVLYAINPETGEEMSRGSWENFRFKLVSRDPTVGETQEQVLSYLGYSVKNLQNKAGEVGLTMTENLLFRPIVRPLERSIEREFGLDYVRLRSNFTSNLFYLTFLNRARLFQQPVYINRNQSTKLDPALALLQSSEITLGKYLSRNLYLTYTGKLVSVYDQSKLGINHQLSLEYRLIQNFLLELEYDKVEFNTFFFEHQELNDFRVRLRRSFNF